MGVNLILNVSFHHKLKEYTTTMKINYVLFVFALLGVCRCFQGVAASNKVGLPAYYATDTVPDTTRLRAKFESMEALFDARKTDSGFLYELAVTAVRLKDSVEIRRVSAVYLKVIHDPFNKPALLVLSDCITGTKDKVFEFFLQNRPKIDLVLGKGTAENRVEDVIFAERIFPLAAPYLKEKKPGSPDWHDIENRLSNEFGQLGLEKALNSEMLYNCSIEKDWKKFGMSYTRFFREFGVQFDDFLGGNNLAWIVFENVDDRTALETASQYMVHVLQIEPSNSTYIDTYSNLLYKLGRKSDAITLEEKAVQLSPKDTLIQEALQKMRVGSKTW